VHRDQGCRFPGCEVRDGQGHHLRHWARGGPATLGNLALLCRRHHRAVHEEGYGVEPAPDGALRFRRPDGRPVPEVPPSPAVPAEPVQALRARHEAQGLALDARTTCPGRLGERLDVAWAIDVLHPLANPAIGWPALAAAEPAHPRGPARAWRLTAAIRCRSVIACRPSATPR
jgi:HNH endonuclease